MAKDPSKTEKATPKRRDKTREKGSVPRSQELPKLTVLMAGLFAIRYTLEDISTEMRDIFRTFLGQRLNFQATTDDVTALMWSLSAKLAIMLLPILLVMAVVAYITQRLQVGALWRPKIFEPDFSNIINPMAGLQKLLISPRTFIQLAKQVVMAVAISLVPYLILKNKFNEFLPLFYQTTETFAVFLLSNGYDMVLYTLGPLLIIAILDVWYTRWDYEENMKMSKDEVKDEQKQSFGDQEIKQKQKQKMMEVMNRRMLKDVPKADVVITNPTHIACALSYNPTVSPAPMLLAKGGDFMAERIKDIAREHNVPIRENKPLAQALYKNVEIGQVIPEDLYQAVASILAQLDKFRRFSRPR
ncbi:Flagellar biosynthesis protein FlhB [Desulfovibrio sp. DV]|uniref:flagellar type III secretion system protein FlhB n=1 Tax=Desulfovibrio sp. DV TaxID=1844708 RepID=UPI00094B8096|nr:flagellar type III secretion system protein FlhB [Desulfovibrio sp. DV]OLN28040.1 Flagellar biosynthesis protein FlhB [Desulfovibrio sp. DV]